MIVKPFFFLKLGAGSGGRLCFNPPADESARGKFGTKFCHLINKPIGELLFIFWSKGLIVIHLPSTIGETPAANVVRKAEGVAISCGWDRI